MRYHLLSNRAGLVLSLSLGLACHALAEEVEVKLVVNEARIADALRKFINDKRGEERNIYFLETDDMELSRRGIILRLRETPGSAMSPQ